MQYAASGGRGIVFEIQQGMIDRGADIWWLSQYPHEQEILFAPLTGLEVQSTSCEETVLVVGVSLSVNLASLTIEQVIAKRRKIVADAADGAVIDAKSEALASIAPENADGVAELVRLALDKGVLSRDAEFFNDRLEYIAGAVLFAPSFRHDQKAVVGGCYLLQSCANHFVDGVFVCAHAHRSHASLRWQFTVE